MTHSPCTKVCKIKDSGWTGSDAEGLRAAPILPQGELYG